MNRACLCWIYIVSFVYSFCLLGGLSLAVAALLFRGRAGVGVVSQGTHSVKKRRSAAEGGKHCRKRPKDSGQKTLVEYLTKRPTNRNKGTPGRFT